MEEISFKNIIANNSDEEFTTLVVIEFSRKLPPPSVEWILKKITDPRANGGAELWACSVLDQNLGASVVHIGANINRLLLSAQFMEIKKTYKDGSLREITLTDIDEFQGSADLDSFLTLAEKQKIILHELEAIRATENDNFIPGIQKVSLYHGEAIIARCRSEKLIISCFPLHDREELSRLSVAWYKSFFQFQPLDLIQCYFGETIAMYFAFLGFYTMCLVPPGLLGILSHFINASLFGSDFVPLFCAFNLIWSTIFLESWKRHCSVLAYRWGTIDTEPFEQPRADYYGVLGINKVTGRLEPQYPKWIRLGKFYFVSVPVIGFSLLVAFATMLFYFWLEDLVRNYHVQYNSTFSQLLLLMPTVVYAVVIMVMNAIYGKVAISLNNWENHRLQSAYENHLITKLVLFNFVNCFMSLFYVAFYLQDMSSLRKNLATQLITQQIVQQVMESVIPYFFHKYRKVNIERRHRDDSDETKQQFHVSEEVKLQAEIERTKEEYSGTLDDYLEMFLQFGYVYLFSAVFPSAAFWALINNITEIRTDSFKMCRIFRRPFSRPTSNIGVWQIAFEIMSVVAVMTNCGLIYLSPYVQQYKSDYESLSIIVVFFLIEHAIIFVKVMLSYLIPDQPEWVETSIAAVEYQSKQAWRDKRSRKGQQHLNSRPSRVSAGLKQAAKVVDVIKRKLDETVAKP